MKNDPTWTLGERRVRRSERKNWGKNGVVKKEGRHSGTGPPSLRPSTNIFPSRVATFEEYFKSIERVAALGPRTSYILSSALR